MALIEHAKGYIPSSCLCAHTPYKADNIGQKHKATSINSIFVLINIQHGMQRTIQIYLYCIYCISVQSMYPGLKYCIFKHFATGSLL